jgi:hypothetical protein
MECTFCKMVASIKEALEQAMAKKSKGRPQHETSSPHGSLVHPSFPAQGQPQPSFMGSQSGPPMQGDPMGGMGAGGPPVDPSGNFSGGY